MMLRPLRGELDSEGQDDREHSCHSVLVRMTGKVTAKILVEHCHHSADAAPSTLLHQIQC